VFALLVLVLSLVRCHFGNNQEQREWTLEDNGSFSDTESETSVNHKKRLEWNSCKFQAFQSLSSSIGEQTRP
jgi:hypothetical protein